MDQANSLRSRISSYSSERNRILRSIEKIILIEGNLRKDSHQCADMSAGTSRKKSIENYDYYFYASYLTLCSSSHFLATSMPIDRVSTPSKTSRVIFIVCPSLVDMEHHLYLASFISIEKANNSCQHKLVERTSTGNQCRQRFGK